MVTTKNNLMNNIIGDNAEKEDSWIRLHLIHNRMSWKKLRTKELGMENFLRTRGNAKAQSAYVMPLTNRKFRKPYIIDHECLNEFSFTVMDEYGEFCIDSENTENITEAVSIAISYLEI